MNKKAETKKAPPDPAELQDLLNGYMDMASKIQQLSRLSIREFLGTRPDNDPRVHYLSELETFRHLANVNLTVVMELTIKALGITQADYLKIQNQKLAELLTELQNNLGVTGWDEVGQPLLDLVKYSERTASWPK
jgi:hypothetical protein